jgi:hypothetical protein
LFLACLIGHAKLPYQFKYEQISINYMEIGVKRTLEALADIALNRNQMLILKEMGGSPWQISLQYN